MREVKSGLRTVSVTKDYQKRSSSLSLYLIEKQFEPPE